MKQPKPKHHAVKVTPEGIFVIGHVVCNRLHQRQAPEHRWGFITRAEADEWLDGRPDAKDLHVVEKQSLLPGSKPEASK